VFAFGATQGPKRRCRKLESDILKQLQATKTALPDNSKTGGHGTRVLIRAR